MTNHVDTIEGNRNALICKSSFNIFFFLFLKTFKLPNNTIDYESTSNYFDIFYNLIITRISFSFSSTRSLQN